MIAPTYWRLEEAIDLARTLQPTIRKYGYHLCLGGGVLNAGRSDHDLDLYFLSMDNSDYTIDPDGLIAHLESLWGKGVDLRDHSRPHARPADDAPPTLAAIVEMPREPYPHAPGSPYCAKLMFNYSDLRIDAFVLGGERAKATIAPEGSDEVRPRVRVARPRPQQPLSPAQRGLLDAMRDFQRMSDAQRATPAAAIVANPNRPFDRHLGDPPAWNMPAETRVGVPIVGWQPAPSTGVPFTNVPTVMPGPATTIGDSPFTFTTTWTTDATGLP